MTTSTDGYPFTFGELERGNYIWLTLTNLCNIHCKYCFNYVLNNNQAMSETLAKDIINTHLHTLDRKLFNSFNIIYFGGEPTLNQPALIDCIDFFIKNDINCHQCIMTNGILKKTTFERLINKDIDFQVSFDGGMENLRYNKSQKRLVYDETISGINKLCSAGESVKVRATIHEGNVENIPNLIEFCSNIGIEKIMCSPICEFGDSIKNNIKQPEVNLFVEYMIKAYELSQQCGVQIEIKGEQFFCNLKRKKLNVPYVWLPDGYLAMTITYATSRAKGAENIIIGKYDQENKKIVLKKQTIEKMKENFRRNFNKNCSSCPIKDLCQGTLHFTPFATDTFNYKRDNYFCRIAQAMVKAFPK